MKPLTIESVIDAVNKCPPQITEGSWPITRLQFNQILERMRHFRIDAPITVNSPMDCEGAD